MGDWLPDAHPVGPSGMSATLSRALVKLGIYGLVRLFCSFVVSPAPLRIWGLIVALAGTASLFIGTLTALRQTDTKRLMAFHTIEARSATSVSGWALASIASHLTRRWPRSLLRERFSTL